ncbi:MAG: hypothetical protein CSA74_01110 [Rhodobacterales bacterium]|nr:MAG: hypothetical protein CSA74_01110 [Rhodobacterales bacterium]
MMDANYARFNQRLNTIETRHARRSSGFFRRNGTFVQGEPVRARRGLPMRGIVLSLLAFVAFKGFLLASLGEASYAERVAGLETGSVVEQFGAWAMHADPMTIWIANQIITYF